MEDEIEVREADGTVIGGTTFSIYWEYYGRISAAFNATGTEVTVSGTDDSTDEVLRLPPVPNTK